MASPIKWDLGMATALEAEAIGEPGARRFRIRVTAGDSTASIWCEKEHVDSLAASIERVLAGEGVVRHVIDAPRDFQIHAEQSLEQVRALQR